MPNNFLKFHPNQVKFHRYSNTIQLGCVPKQFKICYGFMLTNIHDGGFDVEQAL